MSSVESSWSLILILLTLVGLLLCIPHGPSLSLRFCQPRLDLNCCAMSWCRALGFSWAT
jgi:hypothetical protein